MWTNTWVALSRVSAGAKGVSEELPSGCSFLRFPSVTVNTQNSPRRLLNLPDSPGMTSFPSALVPDIPVKPSAHCSHSSGVSGIRKELSYTVLPGPVSRKKRTSLPWPYLADAVIQCTPMYPRQALKRGCFASKWPAVPLSDVKALIPGCGSWQTVWQLPHPFPVPFGSTSLLWLGYRAAETPCFHAPLGRSLRKSKSLIPLLSTESLLDSFSLERYSEQYSGTRAILF